MNIKEYIIENNINSPYLKYANNIYTQNGDDGVIKQLLSELEISGENNIVVEFGAWDGILASNTYDLWCYNSFNAILIEANTVKANELIQLTSRFNNTESLHLLVDSNSQDTNSLDNILSRSKFNINDDNFVLLSIDVDGPDYAIWESLKNYKPIIVVIESAGGWSAETEYIGDGASLKSLDILANIKGYTLVVSTGNAYFIRNDKLSKLKNYDNSLTINDYHLSDAMVNNILQNLDEKGDITTFSHPHRWISDEYKTILNTEKNK